MNVTVDGVDYEEASKITTAYMLGLIGVWEKLGKPTDCSTNSGWVVMDNIMQVWMKAFPQEWTQWKQEILDSLETERTIAASVKAGGYFPMSYPTRLYKMIKTLLPKQKLNDDEFIHQMVNRYPFLKTTKYSV